MSAGDDGPANPQTPETRLVTARRDDKGQIGSVNPAAAHGSTLLYPTTDDLHAHCAELSYGVSRLSDRALTLPSIHSAGRRSSAGDRPARSRQSSDNCRQVVRDDNHPFTMTLNPAPGSTKKYKSQVPLYL
jgi:hypothetical protein